MSKVWNADTYNSERRRLIHCYDEFYGSAAEMVARFCPPRPKILDLGAGTGILSATIVERLPSATLHLLDGSDEMLREAANRLGGYKPQLTVQSLTDELPAGLFDAVVSALAIHHLDDAEKRSLSRRVLDALAPEGIFINADQVAGRSTRLENLFNTIHLGRARELGSSDAEIEGAVRRMSHDRSATLADQLKWLDESGFEDSECIFRSFRFAVICGWKPGQ